MSEIVGLCGVDMTRCRSLPWAGGGSFHLVVCIARGFIMNVVTPLWESSGVAVEWNAV
jgi:hypothetical protein